MSLGYRMDIIGATYVTGQVEQRTIISPGDHILTLISCNSFIFHRKQCLSFMKLKLEKVIKQRINEQKLHQHIQNYGKMLRNMVPRLNYDPFSRIQRFSKL